MSSSSSASEPHPTLYFPNGDVVLSALIDSKAPPTTRLFRVHKFLLMHHSATFANMFADAKPGSGESYDGVPMVELQGDKAEDLALLLNYLYNPTQMTFKRFDPNTPLAVSGVIRLADKYCIESLREHLIKVVVSDWPTTLKEWDIFQIEIKAAKEKIALTNAEKEGPDPSDFDHLRDHIPEPASAIAFAQEFGCHQILPAAYYQLSTIEPYHGWNKRNPQLHGILENLLSLADEMKRKAASMPVHRPEHMENMDEFKALFRSIYGDASLHGAARRWTSLRSTMEDLGQDSYGLDLFAQDSPLVELLVGGYVVFLNTHSIRCDALIMRRTADASVQVDHVPLPELSADIARQWAGSIQIGMYDLQEGAMGVRELENIILIPILQELWRTTASGKTSFPNER